MIRKILYFALLSTALLMCKSPASAQSTDKGLSYLTGFKKGTEDSLQEAVNHFFIDFYDCRATELPNEYLGHLDNIAYTRRGKYKIAYSVDYLVKLEFNRNSAILKFYIKSVTSDRLICDLTQNKTKQALNEAPENVVKAFGEFAGLTSHKTWAYVKNGDKPVPYRPSKVPYWYDLNYVVETGSVTYFDIIRSENDMPKEALYKVFENYFTYAYRSGKAVIENRDPVNCSIIAKGIYDDIHNWCGEEIYDVSHIINVQCRDGRARVSFTVGNYDIHRRATKYIPAYDFTRNIAAYEPFGSEKDEEMVECLEKVEHKIFWQFSDMKKAVVQGNTAVEA